MRSWTSVILVSLMVAAGCSGGGDGDGDGDQDTTIVVETIAGGKIGDGRPATEAPLAAVDIAVDRHGDVLLADHGRVRRIDARTGKIETLLREGPADGCIADIPPDQGCFLPVSGVAVDEHDGLLVSDGGNSRVLRLDLGDGSITTVVGCADDPCFSSSDGGAPPLATSLGSPSSIAVGNGAIFVTDSNSGLVLRVDETGVATVAGSGDTESAGSDCPDDVPATSTCIRYGGGIAVDAEGGLLIASGRGFAVRRVDPVTGLMRAFVGRRSDCDVAFRGDGGPAATACLQSPGDVAYGKRGELFISDAGDDRIRRVDGTSGIISTLIQGTADTPLRPNRLTVGPDGDVFVIAWDVFGIGEGNRVLRVDPVSGAARVVAGNGTRDHCGDGGPAKDACFGGAGDLAVAPDGGVLVSETGRIRRIDPRRETIDTIAGGAPIAPDPPLACPDGIATATCLNSPGRLAVDGAGNVFVLEWDYSSSARSPRIRRIDVDSGEMRTVAGGCDYSPEILEPVEGAPALGACLFPSDIAVDAAGHLFFSVQSGIWTVDEDSGRLRLVAPPGSDGCLTGEFCLAPLEIAVAADGAILVLDWPGTRVRRIDMGSGTSTTVAGNGTEGQCGDGGPAIEACLLASHIVIDGDGDLLIGGNGLVRRVDAATGVITTVAGDPTRLTGPDSGIVYTEDAVSVMAIDPLGRLLYLEGYEETRVRRITLAADH